MIMIIIIIIIIITLFICQIDLAPCKDRMLIGDTLNQEPGEPGAIIGVMAPVQTGLFLVSWDRGDSAHTLN